MKKLIKTIVGVLAAVAMDFECRSAEQTARQSSEVRARIEELRNDLARERAKTGSVEESPALIRKIRAELAKVGDVEERAKIIAETKHQDPIIRMHAMFDAAYSGGNDMIAAIVAQLDNPTGYSSWAPKANSEAGRPQGGLVFEPPRIIAARLLMKLVDSPPVTEKPVFTDEDVAKWRDWWKANAKKYALPN